MYSGLALAQVPRVPGTHGFLGLTRGISALHSTWYSQILADQLTLFKLGARLCPQHYILLGTLDSQWGPSSACVHIYHVI